MQSYAMMAKRWPDIDVAVRTALFGLWALSLCLPVWREVNDPVWGKGWQILLSGWLGPLGFQFGWFGNPLLVAYVFQPPSGIIKPLVKTTLLVITALFGWFFRVMPNGSGGRAIVSWGSGYYIWSTAIGMTAAYCLLRPFLMAALETPTVERKSDLERNRQ